MADNPYAQYATPATNPYAQYASGTANAVPVAATTTPDKSLFDKVNDFGNNLGDAFVQNLVVKPAVGITQLASHGITGLANAVAPNSAVAQALTSQNNDRDQSIHDENAQYQKDVPTNTASLIGAGLGQAGQLAVGGVPEALEAVGAKAASLAPNSWPILQKVLSSAAQGGAIAATQPVTTGPQQDRKLSDLITGNQQAPSYLEQKGEQIGLGALTGGAIPLAAAGARGINALAQNVYAPGVVAQNNLARTLGATPENLNALSNYTPAVAGEVPTTAQVLANPTAAMVEKAAANNPDFKIALTEQQNNNNAARLNLLQSVAGDDAQMQAALKARSDMANDYNSTQLAPGQNPIDPSSLITSLKTLQANTLRPAIKNGTGDILSALESARNPDGTVDAGLLDDLRQNANDYLAKHSANGVVPSQVQAALGPIKQQITQTLGANVPGYSKYLADYAQLSQPINDTQLAQKALDSANARRTNTADAPQLNLSDINSVLRSSDKANYGLSPAAQAKIQSLQDSLKSTDAGASVKSPGSDTNFNAQAQGWLGQQMLGNNLQGTGTGTRAVAAAIGAGLGLHADGLTGAGLGAGAGAFINKAADFVNSRIMSRYQAGLLDPATAKTMLTNYLQANSKQAPALLQQYPQWRALLAAPVSNNTQSKP